MQVVASVSIRMSRENTLVFSWRHNYDTLIPNLSHASLWVGARFVVYYVSY